jgi:hypothetical protein
VVSVGLDPIDKNSLFISVDIGSLFYMEFILTTIYESPLFVVTVEIPISKARVIVNRTFSQPYKITDILGKAHPQTL